MAKRILYVEDEINLGRIVKESLETRGFSVSMISDGGAALEAFQRENPDICVLDIMLPHTNGYELATSIRAMQPDMPIIFLTAKTQVEDVVKGFHSGGNDYIRKPFSMEELIVRIEHLLDRTGQPAQDDIPLGVYRFYPHKQVLSMATADRKLSYRETALLQYLWRSRGGIVSRKELLQSIWGDDSFFNSRTLDVYMNKLRGYLRDDPTLEIITVKGVGYRFIV